MATTHSGITTAGSPHFPGVITEINEAAYKMQYENNLLRHLVKQIGQGQKGSYVRWPYFDPTTFATAASTLNEENDFTTSQQLVNASVVISASEFGLQTQITDRVRRSALVDIVAEAGRQIGIGIAHKLDHHILAALGAVVTGTVTGTNSSTGFSFSKFAAAQSQLHAAAITVPDPLNAVVGEYAWYYAAKSTYSETYAAAMGDVGNEILNKWYKKTLFGNINVYTMPLSLIGASSTQEGWMFAKDGNGLWIDQDLRVEPQRDASKRLDEYIGTLTGGSKNLVAGFIKRLNCYGAAPS